MNTFRKLQASEIECRVATVKQPDASGKGGGVSILLYKDARVDMRLLDEVYGSLGWKREHQIIDGRLYCTISVYDEKHGQWVSKQDVGTESYTEKEKGQASDSFKRAGFNWGIGRELYTAPFIWVNLNTDEWRNSNNGKQPMISLSVAEIAYDGDSISYLVLMDKKGVARFTYGIKGVRKTRTSNHANVDAQATQPTLEQAIEAMKATTSVNEVKNVWNTYPQFKQEQSFIDACTEMGTRLKAS